MLREATSILILGLGREGASSYEFLKKNYPAAKAWLYDDTHDSDHDFSTPLLSSLEAAKEQTYDLVIKSPGVLPNHELLEWVRDQGVPVTSNTQLFLDELPTLPFPVQTIGVTGTKGKSTTTSVIFEVLKSAFTQTQHQAFLGGNIGKPALDLISEMKSTTPDQAVVVLEMSSHQLLDLHSSPHIAVIQNIVPEHLDYYGNFENYVAAKANIAKFQTENDYVIFNPRYSISTQLAQMSPGHQLTFITDSAADHSEAIASVTQTHICRQESPLLEITELPLLGQHNLENILPAVAVSHILKLPLEAVSTALKNFKPLPYRLEPVGEINGVQYYNDSLSTVPEAATSAIRSFATHPVILIAGGFDRGIEYAELAETLLDPSSQIDALLLFRPTGEKIYQALKKLSQQELHFPVKFVTTMSEAVQEAAQIAQPGSIVLLSPASPSFGQFKDYADRGDQFTAAVKALK